MSYIGELNKKYVNEGALGTLGGAGLGLLLGGPLGAVAGGLAGHFLTKKAKVPKNIDISDSERKKREKWIKDGRVRRNGDFHLVWKGDRVVSKPIRKKKDAKRIAKQKGGDYTVHNVGDD